MRKAASSSYTAECFGATAEAAGAVRDARLEEEVAIVLALRSSLLLFPCTSQENAPV